MKGRIRKYIILCLNICCLMLTTTQAQMTEDQAKKMARQQKVNFERILTAVQQIQFAVVPEVKRIGLVGFDFSSKDIPEQVVEIVKLQLEQALLLNGFQVVKIPEFKSNPITFIQSKDSSLRIVHQKPLNKIRSNGDSLLSITRKYGIQGFVDCDLAYDITFGYMLSVQLTNANTRELVSTKLLMSNHERAKSAENSFIIDAGLGAYPRSEIKTFTKLTYSPRCSYFGMNFSWRQAFNLKNSGYFGFNTGFDILQTTYTNDSFDFNYSFFMPHAGVRYYISLLSRDREASDYYMEFFQGIGLFSGRTFTLYAEQGFNINISHNMGLIVTFKYLFDPVQFNKTHGILDIGNIGYGIHTFYKF